MSRRAKDPSDSLWSWHDREELLQRLRSAYKSLEEPQRRFVGDAMREQPYRSLVERLAAVVPLAEDTDPNTDVSFNYAIAGEPPLFLRLSMVGPYAMLSTDLAGPSPRFLTAGERTHNEAEAAVLHALTRDRIKLLSRAQLQEAVAIRLPDVPQATVYHALFAPEDARSL